MNTEWSIRMDDNVSESGQSMWSSGTNKYANVKSRLFDKPVSYIKKEEGAKEKIM